MKSQNRSTEEGKIAGCVEISQREGASVRRSDATVAEIAREAEETAGDVRREDEGERRVN